MAGNQGGRSSGGGLGFWGVAAIGVGGMVGGGIFAVLGLAAELARGATPEAFVIGGIVAFLTARSYSRLSVAFPSEGGTVSFLNRAFGPGFLAGSLNLLLWLSYVIMLSLYAFAFGSYGSTFFPESLRGLANHGLIIAVIGLITVLNLFGAKAIGEAEGFIVGIKLVILLVFVGVGMAGIEPARLAPSAWVGPLHVVAGGMIIFVAYEGFELIANTAQDVRDPERTLPRAFLVSVVFVAILYALVAVVTVGGLPADRIAAARDYALAAAARPFLGSFGFQLIAVAALLSTASAINATLYGSARFSYIIARDGELPEVLEHRIWNRPLEGLLLTAVVTGVVANVLDLSSISTVGSAGFLILFGAVNLAAARLARATGGGRALPLVGVGACTVALASLVWQTWTTDARRLWVLVALVGGAAFLEGAYRLASGRELRKSRRVRLVARADEGSAST